MKIVQTNKAYFPHVGGIETTITTLSEGFANDYNEDVSVLVCSERVRFSATEKILNGVKVKYVPTYSFLASLPISPRYFKEIKNYSGDILHVHEPFPLADLSLLMLNEPKKRFSKLVVSWHSDIVRQKWVLTFYRNYLMKFLEMADKIIVSNPNLINNSEFLPHFREKVNVIPIGVNLDWVKTCSKSTELAAQIRDSFKNPLVLCVGRLVYYKGLEYLIEAINRVPEVNLVIVGSGKLRDKLQNRIDELNLSSRVRIIPELDEVTLHAYFKACDLFVLPSVEKSETYGIVQIEAMACGKPLICTEIGTGTTFINQHQQTGLVVPPKNVEELAHAIDLLSKNSDLRKTFGTAGKEKTFNQFTSQIMVSSTHKLYSDLLNQ